MSLSRSCWNIWSKQQWWIHRLTNRLCNSTLNEYSKFKYIFDNLIIKKKGNSIVKINIQLWKKTSAASWRTAWRVRDRSQESHLHSVTHCSADADGREKTVMAERSEPNSAAERVVWTPSNLKSPVWKYFGFWSVDSKNVVPRDKVVCKLCKLQLAYHSTTSNMKSRKCAPKWACHDVWNPN